MAPDVVLDQLFELVDDQILIAKFAGKGGRAISALVGHVDSTSRATDSPISS
jgi:hypothetical protein